MISIIMSNTITSYLSSLLVFVGFRNLEIFLSLLPASFSLHAATLDAFRLFRPVVLEAMDLLGAYLPM